MTGIYLIRHAEAEGNLFRRAQGHWNGKITPLGEKQIASLAGRFRDVKIDAVYSSDLDRARRTAGAVLSGRKLDLRVTPRLRELNMGAWEGEAWGNICYAYPEQMINFNRDLSKWSVPGSEDFFAAQERITGVMAEIAAENEGKTAAVVSHGMIIKIYLMAALGVSPGESDKITHADNTSVSYIEYENGSPRVVYYNDNSHLGELSTLARQSWWRDSAGRDASDMRYVPLDPSKKEDAEFYTDCYAGAWTAAHGSLDGFAPSIYLKSAKSHAKHYPGSLLRVMHGDENAGLLELDHTRGAGEGIGWISLFYLLPEYRGRGLGAQLIGAAEAYFSRLGRTKLRLHAAVTNTRAVEFYKRYGFEIQRTDPGVASDLYLMERSIC